MEETSESAELLGAIRTWQRSWSMSDADVLLSLVRPSILSGAFDLLSTTCCRIVGGNPSGEGRLAAQDLSHRSRLPLQRS